MSPPPLDLLVVGAGPVGLATAAAALQQGAQHVLVVEQASALRPVGSNIDLLPNAYRVLCLLIPGIAERLQPFVHIQNPGKPRAVGVNADGRVLSTIKVRDYGTAASLYWWQLQRILLDSIPRQDLLVLNHRLVNIFHDDSEGVAVAEFVADSRRQNLFKNWEGDDTDEPIPSAPVSCHDSLSFFEQVGVSREDMSEYGLQGKRIRCKARIIVGADGINSVARKCIYRDTSPGWERFADPLYSGFVKVVAAGNPHISTAEEQLLTERYLKNGQFSMLTCNEDKVSFESLRIMFSHAQKATKPRFQWYVGFSVTMDEHTFKTASKEEVCQNALSKARESGFSETLTSLSSDIWGCKNDDIIPNRAYYIIPATHPPPYEAVSTGAVMSYPSNFYRPWHFGRVVLAGDSAHACPPFLAQGTAMGFEDVFVLMNKLKEVDAWSHGHENVDKDVLREVFEQYRNTRLDRVCFMQRRVMNRVSEYEVDKKVETMDKLWTYDPSCN